MATTVLEHDSLGPEGANKDLKLSQISIDKVRDLIRQNGANVYNLDEKDRLWLDEIVRTNAEVLGLATPKLDELTFGRIELYPVKDWVHFLRRRELAEKEIRLLGKHGIVKTSDLRWLSVDDLSKFRKIERQRMIEILDELRQMDFSSRRRSSLELSMELEPRLSSTPRKVEQCESGRYRVDTLGLVELQPNERFEDWWRSSLWMMSDLRVKEAEKVKALVYSMRGKSRTIAIEIVQDDARISIEELGRKIKERLGKPENRALVKQQLSKMRWQPSMDPSVFISELRSKCQIVYADKVDDQLIANELFEKIGLREKHNCLAQGGDEPPLKIIEKELRASYLCYQHERNLNDESAKSRRSTRSVKPRMETQGQLQGSKKSQRKKKPIEEIECYNCRQKGHYASKCQANKGTGSAEKHKEKDPPQDTSNVSMTNIVGRVRRTSGKVRDKPRSPKSSASETKKVVGTTRIRCEVCGSPQSAWMHSGRSGVITRSKRIGSPQNANGLSNKDTNNVTRDSKGNKKSIKDAYAWYAGDSARKKPESTNRMAVHRSGVTQDAKTNMVTCARKVVKSTRKSNVPQKISNG